MEDKLQDFFKEHEFDVFEPNQGHEHRFQQRLEKKLTNRVVSLKWLSLAASITLLIGIFIGNTFSLATNPQLASNSFEQVENYFINTMNVEINELESSRNLETEEIIEEALDRIEELEEEYQKYLDNLEPHISKVEVIKTLTNNYHKRLEILEDAMELIDKIKNPVIFESTSYV